MSPRGIPKRGQFSFVIWFEDGARIEWTSRKTHTNAEIGAAIRRYLVPVMERLESDTSADAVDPQATEPGKLTTREISSSTSSAFAPSEAETK